jgi:hypothetical protein
MFNANNYQKIWDLIFFGNPKIKMRDNWEMNFCKLAVIWVLNDTITRWFVSKPVIEYILHSYLFRFLNWKKWIWCKEILNQMCVWTLIVIKSFEFSFLLQIFKPFFCYKFLSLFLLQVFKSFFCYKFLSLISITIEFRLRFDLISVYQIKEKYVSVKKNFSGKTWCGL